LKKHIISLWVKNKHGVLSRVSGTFNRRAYNIDSFSSGKINDDDIYRMTIILSGEDGTIEMIKKQLTKLQDVERVVETFGAVAIKVDETMVTYEFTGTTEKVDAFLHILDQFEIVSANRSGAVAVE
jgi:acetolactate synthase-1/3 small subunit